MTELLGVFLTMGMAAVATAQNTVPISIGLRETGAGGGAAFTNVGDDGGFAGGIEWINLDGQTLTLDGTWQQFTFDLAMDPVTLFAGATANGMLEGGYGTIEHIRILNNNGVTEPITIFVDDVVNEYDDTNGRRIVATVEDFEGYGHGDEVMFQEPGFSGSTAGNINAGATGGVNNFVASRPIGAMQSDFQFVDNSPTRWLRLTTFNAINRPNPQVRFDGNATITFWMRGGTCQENLGGQGPGTVITEMCGTGLALGESSTYHLAGAQPNAPGALAFSQPNDPDLPILGGTLVSGTGLVTTAGIAADANGEFSVSVPGVMAVGDIVCQAAMLDNTQAMGIAFSNALLIRIGQ